MAPHIFSEGYQNSQEVVGSEFLVTTHEGLSSGKVLKKEEQKQKQQAPKYEPKTEMTMES